MPIKISLSQLEAFRAVASNLSYTRSAEVLGYSEAALCKQVHALERVLRVKLFDVRCRRLELSSLGRELAAMADRIVGEVESFQAAATTLREESGQVILAAAPVTSSFLLRYVLPDLGPENRNVTLTTSNYSTIITGLLSGTFHIGILANVQGYAFENTRSRNGKRLPRLHPELIASPWIDDQWSFLRRPAGELTDCEAILARLRVYYVSSQIEGAPALRTLLSTASLRSEVEYVPVQTPEAARSAALGGMGLSFLPLMSVVDEVDRGLLEVAPFPQVRRTVFIATMRNRLPAVESIYQFLSEWRAGRHLPFESSSGLRAGQGHSEDRTLEIKRSA